MAQNITLMGASYSDVPAVTLPKTGGGTATFYDVEDGDLIGYGSEELNDLTGTTWYFNQVLTYDDDPLDVEINFTSNETQYIGLCMNGGELAYVREFDRDYVYYEFDDGWYSQNDRTISITGGTDATNTDLIAWITANATQI